MAHVQASRLLVRAEARMRLQQPAAAVRWRGEEGSVGGGEQRGFPGPKGFPRGQGRGEDASATACSSCASGERPFGGGEGWAHRTIGMRLQQPAAVAGRGSGGHTEGKPQPWEAPIPRFPR